MWVSWLQESSFVLHIDTYEYYILEKITHEIKFGRFINGRRQVALIKLTLFDSCHSLIQISACDLPSQIAKFKIGHLQVSSVATNYDYDNLLREVLGWHESAK